MTTSLPQQCLPSEILLDSIDYAAVSGLGTGLLPEYRTLRKLSLVSKEVSRYAQKKLFCNVFLFNSRHALAFGVAVNPGTERGRWLASLVRTLTVLLRHLPGGITQKLCTAALRACPELRELAISVPQVFEMPPFSSVFIEGAPPLKVLRIAAPGTMSLGWLHGCPSLRHVEFGRANMMTIPQGPAPACQLLEMHWPGPINDVLSWILRRSAGTLEILGLHTDRISTSEDSAFELMMQMHGTSIRSLQVPNLTDSQARCLVHCTRLEELICGSNVVGCNDIFSPGMIDKLPGTLQHLQVQGKMDVSPTFAEYIPRLAQYFDVAPSLHTVTWVHPAASRFKDLRETCERRGIVWRAWLHTFGTFSGERQELGVVKRFPRPVWLSPVRARLEIETT